MSTSRPVTPNNIDAQKPTTPTPLSPDKHSTPSTQPGQPLGSLESPESSENGSHEGEQQTLETQPETNIFIQLENYLASDKAKQDAQKYRRKLRDFVEVIDVELPEQPTVQKNDETDEFAANGVLDSSDATVTANEDYFKKITAITKNYNQGFLGVFIGHSGEFKRLMQALHNTLPGDIRLQHRTYMTRLEGETSEIAIEIKRLLDEPSKLQVQQSWVEGTHSQANKK